MTDDLKPLEVHKFGGTSLADAARLQSAAGLLSQARDLARPVAVVSAMAGVTDQLVQVCERVSAKSTADAMQLVEQVHLRHVQALRQIDPRSQASEVAGALQRARDELVDLVRGAVLVGELTDRTRDRILAMGEKCAARLLQVTLEVAGIPAVAMNADEFLETDDRFGMANPVGEIAQRTTAAAVGAQLARGRLPVVTGFCGRAPDGATTTLGRGGSDLSATVVAAALDAREVVIWTDVDGVYSADPRVVPEARLIRQLNFREAAELSHYGAKVLHQRSMIPAARKNIPVRVQNSLQPESPPTRIDNHFTPGSHPVKAISAVRDHTLVSLEGKGMAGVPGVAARLFGALAACDISVTVISQSSSESTICIAVQSSQAQDAERAIKREFRPDLSRGDIEEVVLTGPVGLVAAVGLGMAHTPGVAARVFSCLARRNINVLAIAQGSSELNITLAVEAQDVDAALRALHTEFGLHRLDTGEDSTRGFDLLLIGCGHVGRALVEQVLERRSHLFARFGLKARIVAIADRSGYLLQPAGIPLSDLMTVIEAKARGEVLSSLPGARSGAPLRMVQEALTYRLARPVLVDVSDADDAHLAMLQALQGGCDVVTANKKPLAGSLANYTALMESNDFPGRLMRAEATVGAGLPVMDTLQMMLDTGDQLHRAEGALSGTLGFITSALESGQPFSEAVRQAQARGFTEPDPVADLCGADVARKAIILGRLSSLVRSDVPVQLTGLVDAGWAGLERVELFARLQEMDAGMAERVARSKAQDKSLRYLARIESGNIQVGLTEVAADSPFATLKGTDNMIVFESDRYADRPLVVVGPGAGIQVTAMGVLSDILRIAAERRRT